MKLAGAFLALIPLAFGGMEKVWEVRVGDFVKEPAGWDEDKIHAITALAFSPDGKRLALAIDATHRPHAVIASDRTHILILDLTSPKDHVSQFDVQTCPEPLTWAPSGEALMLCGMILRVADGRLCDALTSRLRIVSGRISPTMWIDRNRVFRRADSAILDLDCEETETWSLPDRWTVRDIAPSKGRALVMRVTGAGPRAPLAYAVVAVRSHEVTGAHSFQSTPGGKARLVAGADAWCVSLVLSGPFASHCWQIETDREIRLTHGVNHYLFEEAAISSPRVIVEQWGHSHGFLSDLFPDTLKRRAVYDFSSQMVLASWKPCRAALATPGSFRRA